MVRPRTLITPGEALRVGTDDVLDETEEMQLLQSPQNKEEALRGGVAAKQATARTRRPRLTRPWPAPAQRLRPVAPRHKEATKHVAASTGGKTA